MSQLFPYQIEGVAFLKKRRLALLADEMGLGKTVQTIKALDAVGAKKVLIICPAIAKINWLREFEMWSGTKRKYKVCQGLIDLPDREESVICSFEYAAETYPYLKGLGFDVLVVDEAHYLKEPTSKRANAILGRKGISWGVKRTWFLSGTPAPNHPGELWLMLFAFGITKLSQDQFLKKFCLTRQTGYGLKVMGANRQAIPELQKLLQPLMLRRLKKDVLKDLPDIAYHHFFVEPAEVDIRIYPTFLKYYFPFDKRDKLMEKIEAERKHADAILSHYRQSHYADIKADTLNILSDSVSTLRRYIGCQKILPAVDTVLKCFKFNAKQYKKLVIFAIHVDVIEGLRTGLDELNPVVIYGGTAPNKKQHRIDRFRKDPSCKVLIGNIRAAGIAINLTVANNILFVEQDWVPGNNAQAVMRCHRIGQKNKVFIRMMALNDSLDSHVMLVLKKKTRDLTAIFDENLLQNTQQNDNNEEQIDLNAALKGETDDRD